MPSAFQTPELLTHPRARVREWQHLTGTDFARMDRARTVVMLTCSPLEVHGPHLPVITDNIEGEAMSFRTMEILSERYADIEFVHMPPIYVAADVLPHPGSVMFRSSTITRVMSDLGRSLACQGFKHIWISSFHGGPRHFVPIEVACERTNRRYGTSMVCAFSLLINRLTNGGSDLAKVLGHLPGLTPEDLDGDHHGGAIETSIMLHLIGDKVGGVYRELPQRTLNRKLEELGQPAVGQGSVGELVRGFRHKIKYYEDETYSGKPALGDPDLGRQIIDVLATHSADALQDLWLGKLLPENCHSPLWPLRWVFTNRALGWAFERAVGYRQRVF